MAQKQRRCYYEILGLDRESSTEDIRKAYHKLALVYHPDRNKGNEAEAELRFKEISEAYEVLSNPSKRVDYNRYAKYRLDPQTAGISQDIFKAFDHFFSNSKTNIFSELFGEGNNSRGSFENFVSSFGHSFSNKRSGCAPKKGQTLRTTLPISIEESLKGCIKTIELKRLRFCESCGGGGQPQSAVPEPCTTCGTLGALPVVNGSGAAPTLCPTCRGVGHAVRDTCRTCQGVGKLPLRKELRVEIPVGVTSGMKKVYEGEGDVGDVGSAPGDLLIVFDVAKHPFFRREGNDAIGELVLTYPQAVLGTKLKVPSLYGDIEIVIQPGVQCNEVIKIVEHGFPTTEGVRGDLFLRILIAVPRVISEEQRQLLLEFASAENSAFSSSGLTPTPQQQQPHQHHQPQHQHQHTQPQATSSSPPQPVQSR